MNNTMPGSPPVQTRRPSRIVWLIPIGMLAAVALTIGLGIYVLASRKPPEPPKPKLTNVEVVTLKHEMYEETLHLPGKILADTEVPLASELGGTLLRWHVPEGAAVKKSQIIAQLDPSTLKAQRSELAASLSSAKAGVAASESGLQLAQLEVQSSDHALASAKNRVAQAKSNVDLQKKELDRIAQLTKKKIASESDLDRQKNAYTQATLESASACEDEKLAVLGQDRAKVAVAQARANATLSKARVAEIEAALKSVDVSLGKITIRAPIDGVIDKYLVEAGSVISPGTPITTVYDLSHVRVIAHVADRYAPFLANTSPAVRKFLEQSAPGSRLNVSATLVIPGLPKLTSGREKSIELPAQIARVAHASDPRSNTFDVELRLPNYGNALKQGIIVRAKIKVLEYPDAIVVPVSAIRVTDDGPRCLVVAKEKNRFIARLRDIDPRSITGNRVLVTDGLKADEMLIVAGAKGVLDGEEVHIIKKDGKITTSTKTKTSETTASATE